MKFFHRLRTQFRKQELDKELSEELAFHIEKETEENIAAGMTAEEAHYAALRRFGGMDQVKEECRDAWGVRFIDTLLQDLRFCLRMLVKNPGFTAVAVFTLALGIGANTAMFTVIRSVLLKPLAYPDPDRLVQTSGGATSIRFEEMRSAARSYAELGDYLGNLENITLSGSAEPEVLKSARVSANYLNILEVRPLLGQGFRSEEDTAAGPRVAMISSELWRRHFDANPKILGKTIILAATPYVIVGVLPDGFQFPFPDVDVWRTRPSEDVSTTTSPILEVFGRLNPGVDLEQATSELAVLNQQYRTAHPGMLDGKPNTLEHVMQLRDRLVADVRFMLWMLFGAVGFVLLIGCANVASLLLARATSRSREFAVRAAVGASRVRLIRQLLAESVVLGVVGGALGVLLAKMSLSGIVHMTVLDLPRVAEIRVDGIVLSFSVLLSIGTGVLFGLSPLLGVSCPDLASVVRTSDQVANSTRRKRVVVGLSARSGLVIGQVALSIVLLIGAGLMMRSLARLYGVNPGFNPSHLLTLHISLPPSRYDTDQKQSEFFEEFAQRVQLLPGVRNAAAMWALPFTGFSMTPVQLANQPPQPLNLRALAVIERVTPSYFRTMEVPLKRGRGFSPQDVAGAPVTAIINERLAHVLWPSYPNGIDPVGQRILIGIKTDAQIIGIVADMHQALETDPRPEVFRPFAQSPLLSAAFAVRTAGDPLHFVHVVSDQALAVDRDQPVSEFKTMEDLMEAEGGQRRLLLLLLGCFACAALLLTVFGIYGVVAYSVEQRTREVGIRMALGANQRELLRMVIGQGVKMALLGVAIGVVASLALTRLMASLLFGVTAHDPLTIAGVATLMVLFAVAACYVPARRATKVDPMVALRYE